MTLTQEKARKQLRDIRYLKSRGWVLAGSKWVHPKTRKRYLEREALITQLIIDDYEWYGRTRRTSMIDD